MTIDPFQALTDDELQTLENLLLFEIGTDESMTLDILDGYLHAIAIGPTTLHPAQWLPKVWGVDSAMPPMASLDQLNHVVGLIMRHLNNIVSGLQLRIPEIMPIWVTETYQKKTYQQGESWAYGFIEGMQLCWGDWKPMLDTDEGKAWFRPFGLLSEHDFSPDQDELTKTPARRAKLTKQLPTSVLAMHAYWLPYRLAVAQRQIARKMQPKVGRNDPCPCGSGKKFKRCCGHAADLH